MRLRVIVHPLLFIASVFFQHRAGPGGKGHSAAGVTAPEGTTVAVREDTSEVGSGSYPAHQIPTFVVSVRHPAVSADEIARRLRVRPYAVFGRVKEDAFLIDPRTVQEDELEETSRALTEVLEGGHGG